MDLNGFKKYASKAIPFLSAGKSEAQHIKKALIRRSEGQSSADDQPLLDKWAKTVESAHKQDQGAQKLVAHVAVKLLDSSAARRKEGKVGAEGAKLLQDLAETAGTQAKDDALNRVFGHYQNKQTLHKFAIGTFVASSIATIGAFAGAGAAGIVPLLASMAAGTMWAKSRKAGRRIKLLNEEGASAKTFESLKTRELLSKAYPGGVPASEDQAKGQAVPGAKATPQSNGAEQNAGTGQGNGTEQGTTAQSNGTAQHHEAKQNATADSVA